MIRPFRASSLLICLSIVPAAGFAQAVDLAVAGRIRAEAVERSQVMDLARELTDVLGPRLTGSPALLRANQWTREKLASWGLEGARLDPFDFGQGWEFSRCEVRMVAPHAAPLAALPKAWTPGTSGTVRGDAVRVELASEEDLEEQKGKLAGKILLLAPETPERDGARGPYRRPDFERYDDEKLEELEEIDLDEPRGDAWRKRARERFEFGRKLAAFLVEEGVLATVERSSRELGILRVGGESVRRDPSYPRGVPVLVMAAEPYQRVERLLERGGKVELEIAVEASFLAGETNAHSTLAEIPGGESARELVVAGAHLDSWHAGTGATDDAAGVAVVMEAARILKSLGTRPRRTIRFALWAGEEQGLLGSAAYVQKYVADRPEPTDAAELALPRNLREPTWPVRPKAEHARISAYFNLDNGGGRIRGIYTQGNLAAAPVFRSWLAPLADLGATAVTNESTGSTDHVPFDRVGVPAFQFIQDPLDYLKHSHHTDLDTFERLKREDLVQASIVMATFLWQAANREELLPRKPFPTEPVKQEKTTAPPAAAH